MLTYQWTFEEEKWNLRDGAGASLFEPQTNEEVRSLTSLYYRRFNIQIPLLRPIPTTVQQF
jgi:hypothetical protein